MLLKVLVVDCEAVSCAAVLFMRRAKAKAYEKGRGGPEEIGARRNEIASKADRRGSEKGGQVQGVAPPSLSQARKFSDEL